MSYNGGKKVKFSKREEIEKDFETGNYEKEIVSEYEEEAEEDKLVNDLDLDTIRSKSKSKGIKNVEYSDDEELEAEEEEAEDNLNQPNWDSESSQSESESEQGQEELDDREIQLEPFNLKTDREEGTFDSEGFFQKSHDSEASQDRWLNNLTRSDIVKAKVAHEKIERERKVKEQQQRKDAEVTDKKLLYKELFELISTCDNPNLNPSVLDTIRNLSLINPTSTMTTAIPSTPAGANRAPINKNRLKKLEKEQSMKMSDDSTTTAAYDNDRTAIMRVKAENIRKINRITEIADSLLNQGNFNIYEETRREIESRIQ